MFNRPIAPHLTIYIPQISSIFSIWHRISGVILVVFIVLFMLVTRAILSLQFYNNLMFLVLPIWSLKFNFIIVSLFFGYHMFNGVRHILWDLNFLLNLTFLFISSLFISFFVCLMLLQSILKI